MTLILSLIGTKTFLKILVIDAVCLMRVYIRLFDELVNREGLNNGKNEQDEFKWVFVVFLRKEDFIRIGRNTTHLIVL